MPKKPRTEPRGPKYDELIETSARIFAQNGFKDTSIQDIAREMNWTSAAIYYYVKSKDDILYEIWRRAGEKLQLAADDILALDLPVIEKIRLFFRRHAELIIGDRPIFEVLILERSRIPLKGANLLEQDERKYLRTLAGLIAELPPDRLKIGEPYVLALGGLSMLNGIIRWYRSGGRLSLQQIADIYCDMFMSGVCADPAP